MEFLGLVHVSAPLLAVGCVLVDFELVGYSLHLEHPLFATNRRLKNLLLKHIILVFSGSATEVHIVVDLVFVALDSVHVLVTDIGVAFELVSHFVGVVVVKAALVADHGLLEPYSIFDADLAQSKEHCAHAVSMTRLESVGRHV